MPGYPIYLDHNATTPCDPDVLAEMLPFFSEHFGNAASRSHAYGWSAEDAVDIARARLARLIGASPAELTFTSGATEALNLAIQGLFNHRNGGHIITLATEHSAVLDTCRWVEEAGIDITRLPVDRQGYPDLEVLEAAIRPDTRLIAAMYAHNETGLLLPVQEMADIAHRYGVLFLSDATQAIGKIPVDLRLTDIDLLACSAHKMYGPKGIGVLYVRKGGPGKELQPLLHGGGHERGRRSGTLNVPGIVGFGMAAEQCRRLMPSESIRLAMLRDRLFQGLADLPGMSVNGDRANLLPHVLNLCFDLPGADRLVGILARQVALSSGAACTSVSTKPSHVLLAMGRSPAQALSSIRFSLGRSTADADIEAVIEYVRQAVASL